MDFEALQTLILEVARERETQAVQKLIADRLSAQPGVALVRIWLIEPGDICPSCPMRLECPDQSRCLHLAASNGSPTRLHLEDWSRTSGDFRRFPLGVRKIGRIAATGEPILLADIRRNDAWIARPAWADREGIHSFAGQPLIFHGEVLGVLGVFSRTPIDEQGFRWIRMLADHAAASIAHCRSFKEILRLREQLELENDYLREEVKTVSGHGDIVGGSPVLRKVLEQIDLVAPTDASVLILGESGTGKELIARAVHERSRRAARVMVKVNCASVPRELFESEFFGHVKGSFTGAVKDRLGRFQLADGGTLFLDEVGEIPLELQGKLLRVLQEGQFERVGEDTTRKVNVRVVAATNRDLKREAEAGRFREDLYFRLSVFPIEVPPLRRRREDVPALAEHFVRLAAARFNRPTVRLTQAGVRELQRRDWPGNIRELQHVIERTVIASRGGPLDFGADAGPESAKPVVTAPAPLNADPIPEKDWKTRRRDNILAALERSNGKIHGPGGAAELLGVKATTLASRLKTLGIKKKMMIDG